jgi:hypothetical protein
VSEGGGTHGRLARRLGAAAGYLALFAASWVVASLVIGDDVPVVAIVLLAVAVVVTVALRLRSGPS